MAGEIRTLKVAATTLDVERWPVAAQERFATAGIDDAHDWLMRQLREYLQACADEFYESAQGAFACPIDVF